MRTLVIGYGNPLRQDDGLGYAVALRLAELVPDDRAAVIACHQLTPELAEPISHAELVVFVDARQGADPGQIDWQPVAPSHGISAPFSHHVEPRALLDCARQLYGARPPAVAVSVAGLSFGYGATLSPTIDAVVPTVVERIRHLIEAGLPTERGSGG